MADKTEYLSREQMILRQQKEVYNHHGFADGHLMSGLYKRAYNPEAGNRPKRQQQDES